MRHGGGPTYTPDGAAAADMTATASEREAAADGLVRGERVREAAKDALVNAAGTDDERDSGSQLPQDVAEEARGLARVWRRARGRIGGESIVKPDAPAPADGAANASGEVAGPETGAETAGTKLDGAAAARPIPTSEVGPTHGPAGTRDDTVAHKRGGAPDGQASTRRTTKRGGASMTREARVGRPGSQARSMTRHGNTDRTKPTRRRRTPYAVAGRTSTAPPSLAAGGARATAGVAAGGGSAATSSTGATTAAAVGPVAAGAAIVLVLLLLLLTILVGGAVDEDQRAGAHRLAQTATDEYLEGEARGDWNHKGLKYSAYVRGTHGGRDDWDVCLVSWCMAQAGFEGAGLTGRYADVDSYLARFRYHPELGEVHDWYGEDYAPVEGDLFVVPHADGTSHIGVVTSCDGTWFETVEGDVAGGPDGLYDRDEEDGLGGYVAFRTRRLGQYSYTFIHPYYSEEAVAGT